MFMYMKLQNITRNTFCRLQKDAHIMVLDQLTMIVITIENFCLLISLRKTAANSTGGKWNPNLDMQEKCFLVTMAITLRQNERGEQVL